jgi:ABC-2 type transport system permease protein
MKADQPPYNQLKAMLAITRASLRAIFRSPSAVVFGFGFPLIFILVFGFIGGGGNVSFKIAVDKNSDTSNPVYKAISSIPAIKIVSKSQEEITEDLEKGRILAIMKVTKNPAGSNAVYNVDLKSSEASNPQNLNVFQQSILNGIIGQINKNVYPQAQTIAAVNPVIEKVPGRVYRTIDFILPGQLGFSLLSSGVFGVAFMFFNLRQQLVLKRFYATPIKRSYIVLGEAISRVIFQMLTAIIIIGVGNLLFKFTLVNGWITFLNIMVLSFIALIVFMGFGLSSVALRKMKVPFRHLQILSRCPNSYWLEHFFLSKLFLPGCNQSVNFCH